MPPYIGTEMRLDDLLTYNKLQSLPESDWRCSMFIGKNDEVQKRRDCIIRLLDFAEGQGILDVVIADTESVGLRESAMISAIFSRPKITYRLVTEPVISEQQEVSTIHYDLQGIVQKSIRTRLSAVSLWHHKWTREPSGALDIYHNPKAAKQIPYRVLEIPNVCQLVPKEMGIMEWTPSRPLV